jgi:Ca2+-dependent lipid-binding protein
VPLPIFVELQGLVGTVRLRMAMTPEAPFLKTLTFTLMGAPQVTAGCIPMVEKGVNILNLPLISNFVNYAIKAAASSKCQDQFGFFKLANLSSVRRTEIDVY